MQINQLCDPLAAQHNAFCSRLDGMRGQFTTLLGALQTAVTALGAQPQAAIDSAIAAVNAIAVGLDDTIPADVRNLMSNQCFQPMIPPASRSIVSTATSIRDFPRSFSNKLLKNIRKGLLTTARAAVGSVVTGVVSAQISSYEELVQTSGLAEVLAALDYTYSCLTSLCGRSVTDCSTSLRSTLLLDSSNQFDDSIISTWNPNATVQSQLSSIRSALSSKESIISSLGWG